MKYFRLLLLLLAPTVFATTMVIEKKPSFCPSVNQLSKNPKTLSWSGPHRWQSFNPSFATKLTRLKKVQWQGTNIGTIICVYDSNNPSAFPVFIQGPGSYQRPKGDHWVAKKGYLVCVSNERLDCPLHHVHEHKVRLNTNQQLLEFLHDVKNAPKPLPAK